MSHRSYGNSFEGLKIAVLSKHDLSVLGPGDKLHAHDKIMALAKQTQVILFTPHKHASSDMESHMRIIQFSPPGLRFALALTVALFAHRKDYDCIYSRDPLLIALAVPMKAFRKAMIIEMNGIPSLETEIRRTRKVRAPSLTPLICGLIHIAETIAIRCADLVLPVTKKMRTTIIRDYGANPRRVIVVPNSVDTTVFRPLEDKREEVRRTLGIGRETVVLYLGTFSASWRRSEQLFQVAANIQHKRTDIVFLVVGSGPVLADIRSMIERYRTFDRMLFVGAVDHHLVPFYINAADVYVYDVTEVDNRLVRKQGLCPTKILEAMACGKPVIAAKESELEMMLSRSNGGFSASSLAEMEILIERFADSAQFAKSIGVNGRQYVELSHDLTRLAWSTIELISEVASSRRS